MSLADKIPGMSDVEVTNLLANAKRLSESGDPRQQSAAADLLPALEEAAAARHAVKLEAAAAKRSAARKPAKAAAA